MHLNTNAPYDTKLVQMKDRRSDADLHPGIKRRNGNRPYYKSKKFVLLVFGPMFFCPTCLAVFRSYCSVSYCSVSVSELPDGIRKGSGVVTMPEQHQCRDHLKTLNFNSSLTAQIIQKFLASPVFAQSCPVQRMPSAVLFENRKTETEKTNKDYKN